MALVIGNLIRLITFLIGSNTRNDTISPANEKGRNRTSISAESSWRDSSDIYTLENTTIRNFYRTMKPTMM